VSDSVLAINGHARLRAPAMLSPDERRVFAEVVTAAKAGHFEASDIALLVEFARTTILVTELWAALRAAAPEDRVNAQSALGKAQKTLFSCARLLRLSPSGRTPNPNTRESQRRSSVHHHRAPNSVYDQMEAMETDEQN
jgi:hypothetical protein